MAYVFIYLSIFTGQSPACWQKIHRSIAGWCSIFIMMRCTWQIVLFAELLLPDASCEFWVAVILLWVAYKVFSRAVVPLLLRWWRPPQKYLNSCLMDFFEQTFHDPPPRAINPAWWSLKTLLLQLCSCEIVADISPLIAEQTKYSIKWWINVLSFLLLS